MVQTEEYHKTELVSRGSSDSSVFSNPFKAKEDRKRAMLERHVEMTAKQEDQRTLRGKKICWNFRKGRCRSPGVLFESGAKILIKAYFRFW